MKRAILWAELSLALGIFVACNFWHLLPLGETPWIFLLGWASLRSRGKGWASVGFVRPARWGRAVTVAAVAGVGLQLLSTFVTEPLITVFTHRPTDLSEFAPLIGNLKMTLGVLVVVWIMAGFGEELVFRGYILNRVADLGSGTRAAWLLSYLCVSLLFGFGHLYQGPTGVADTTVTGLLLGGLYLACGRNLWIPILTHGFSNTIALGLVYLDLVPNLRK